MHATLISLIKTFQIFPFQANLMDPIPSLPPRKLRSNVSLQIQLPIDDDELASDDYDYDGEICNLDLFSSDEFRMYEFKVRRCTRARSHDWTDCPFAHPGEKARRRDPRKHHYSATLCPEYKSRAGHCPRADSCEFAHGVFECWLHPARYRTMPCRDGKGCTRKVCFFAHTRKQLRVAPSSSLFLSPTSTLVGFGCCSSSAPSPESPTAAVGFGTSRSKREVFGELVGRLEAMQILQPPPAGLMPVVSESGGGDGGGSGANPSWYAPDFEWVDELLEQG